MVQEIKTYKTADLVLQVPSTYNPLELKLSEWDRFIDILCNEREYQKEAIRRCIIYLASNKYSCIEDLIEENWKNPKMGELKNKYSSFAEYESSLQLPHRLSCNVDLATGTGKSYVMYGIAQIMLGMGVVDKVLILCPSVTIETGLMRKFSALAQDQLLLQSLPATAKYRNPSIKSGKDSIGPGEICIENIHAVYENNQTSILESFGEANYKYLILNDESHHIYNKVEGRDKTAQDIKKWKEFLVNPKYNFRYIVGFTGTAYVDDEYFNDVIYRYSLRQAVLDKVVKMIDYVSQNDDAEESVKFQEIYDNHVQNRLTYRKVKPISILITKDITAAKRLYSDFKDFLVTKENASEDDIHAKILIVTSASEHKANLAKLNWVDSADSETEWIISVSMLSEGWDVKNVFQIVPWEDRAFNSKLLIAQVLGRGLRIPEQYQTPQPKVRVFNHASWSKNIKGLIDEVLEIEMRLTSQPLLAGYRSELHFSVHHINYEREAKEKESSKPHREFDYTKGYIELQAQSIVSDKETEYVTIRGEVASKNTLIELETYSIDEVVNKIYTELKIRDWEGKILKLPKGNYTKELLPPKEEIKGIIQASMEKVGIKGERLIEKNKHKIESSFNTLLRKAGKTTYYEKRVLDPFIIETIDIHKEALSVGNLRHSATVFYSSSYEEEIKNETLDILNAVIEDESFPKSSAKQINSFLFKTPIDLVFTKHEPERKFVEQLCKEENAKHITSWIKSRDVSFYSIEYTITTTAGKHSKTLFFNPDFFLKMQIEETNHFIVIEIKADDDVTLENSAKLKYARNHFQSLNRQLDSNDIREKYTFHILSPNSYSVFFDYLRTGRVSAGKFRSDLEDKLDGIDEN